jgi:hypothetical protein
VLGRVVPDVDAHVDDAVQDPRGRGSPRACRRPRPGPRARSRRRACRPAAAGARAAPEAAERAWAARRAAPRGRPPGAACCRGARRSRRCPSSPCPVPRPSSPCPIDCSGAHAWGPARAPGPRGPAEVASTTARGASRGRRCACCGPSR